jgi:SecY interacting protein Syd
MDENVAVGEILGGVLAGYVEKYDPEAEFDPEWPSPCVSGEPEEGAMVRWNAVPMEQPPSSNDVEEATGVRLHPDAVSFYGSWWAGEVEMRLDGQVVRLNTVWNEEELEEVWASVREHLESQEQAGLRRRTLPIAGTDSDLYFALDNETGEVVLEEPGHPPLRVVAPSLGAFLSGLEL